MLIKCICSLNVYAHTKNKIYIIIQKIKIYIFNILNVLIHTKNKIYILNVYAH